MAATSRCEAVSSRGKIQFFPPYPSLPYFTAPGHLMPLFSSVAHPLWCTLNTHAQMCPACSSSCPVLSGSCLCLVSWHDLFSDPQRILLWGWGQHIVLSLPPRCLPSESKTSLSSQGSYFLFLKHPFLQISFFISQSYLKSRMGPKRQFQWMKRCWAQQDGAVANGACCQA